MKKHQKSSSTASGRFLQVVEVVLVLLLLVILVPSSMFSSPATTPGISHSRSREITPVSQFHNRSSVGQQGLVKQVTQSSTFEIEEAMFAIDDIQDTYSMTDPDQNQKLPPPFGGNTMARRVAATNAERSEQAPYVLHWWMLELWDTAICTDIQLHHRQSCEERADFVGMPQDVCDAKHFRNLTVELFFGGSLVWQSPTPGLLPSSPSSSINFHLEQPVTFDYMLISRLTFGDTPNTVYTAPVALSKRVLPRFSLGDHLAMSAVKLRQQDAQLVLQYPQPTYVPIADTIANETQQILSYLENITHKCKSLQTIGGKSDGDGEWQVCLDNLPPHVQVAYNATKQGINTTKKLGPESNPRGKDRCIVYSIGSNGDFSFDDEMAGYGCEVHTFDPTMGWPAERYERYPGSYRYGIGLAKVSSSKLHPRIAARIAGRAKEWTTWSLEDMMANLNHSRISVLKMDVEGNEWRFFESMLSSNVVERIDQLMFEVHLWTWGYTSCIDKHPTHQVMHAYHRTLRRLGDLFDIFAFHANPLSFRVKIPGLNKKGRTGKLRCCYEISLVRRRT